MAAPADLLPLAAKLFPGALRLTAASHGQGSWKGNNLMVKLLSAMVRARTRTPMRPQQLLEELEVHPEFMAVIFQGVRQCCGVRFAALGFLSQAKRIWEPWQGVAKLSS